MNPGNIFQMNEFRADLHCHSTCSDGTFTPAEIITLAQKIGLKAISITDHDNISAYDEAIPLCRELKIELLTGVELSSSYEDKSVHILGYGFTPNNPIIQAFCNRHAERRTSRNTAILELLKKHGMPLTQEEITPPPTTFKPSIGRPHIALAMVKRGYTTSLQEAFKKYLAEGRPCYTHGTVFSVEETLETIHQAGGLAIIAHPHLIPNQQILRSMLEMKFDGIECYYGNFGPDQHKRWLEIAKKKDWLITGGSDFHGSNKPMIDLGCSWIGEDTFQALKERLKNKE